MNEHIHLIIGILIFGLTIGLIMLKPWRLNEMIAALLGAIAMLIGNFISLFEAWKTLLGLWNVFGFFIGLMVITALADEAGFFTWVASLAAKYSKNSPKLLFFNLFIVGIIITVILSNDATALILTPVFYNLVKKLNLNPLPYMFSCCFIANTASFILPVSNPLNIIMLTAFSANLGSFIGHLLLANLIAIALNILLFYLIFRDSLKGKFEASLVTEYIPVNPHLFRFTQVSLLGIAIFYILASIFELPLSIVALTGALVLLSGAYLSGNLKLGRLNKEISWSILGFIAGMFIVIAAFDKLGLIEAFAGLTKDLYAYGTFVTILGNTFLVALGANLINNLPMAMVMVNSIQHTSSLTSSQHSSLVYSTMMGADLGPNLTPLGSLSSMLWLIILRRKGLNISSLQYFKIGLFVTPVMLLGSACGIWIAVKVLG